jgi:hypothetical protein
MGSIHKHLQNLIKLFNIEKKLLRRSEGGWVGEDQEKRASKKTHNLHADMLVLLQTL